MPKRPVPSCGRSTRSSRPKRKPTLVSPLASSTSRITPTTNGIRAQALFCTPVTPIVNILDNRCDASIYSVTQLSWMQSQDKKRFKSCLDFVQCDDSTLIHLFPSKFGSSNRIPISYRHTALSIRKFQELGNKQQLQLNNLDTPCPFPSIPEQKSYPCLGIQVQNLAQTVVNESRQNIRDGYGHLVREAIRSRADNIRDELYLEYYTGIHGILLSKGSVRLLLKEMNNQMYSKDVTEMFYFTSTCCSCLSDDDNRYFV